MDQTLVPRDGPGETFVSYARNFEDVMLWRALSGVREGFYIDAGAGDPDMHSLTRAFHEHGWRGINVEPALKPFAALVARRTDDINLRRALSDTIGEQVFHVVDDPALSSLEPEIAAYHRANGSRVREMRIPTTTLAEICRQHVTGDIHFLSVTVEGSEAKVLRGADFTGFRPWIVLMRAVFPLSRVETHAAWEPMLLAAGYRFAWFDGLKRFYIAAEKHAELAPHFHLPPNLFDRFQMADPAKQAMAEELETTRMELQYLRRRIQTLEGRVEAQGKDGQGKDGG